MASTISELTAIDSSATEVTGLTDAEVTGLTDAELDSIEAELEQAERTLQLLIDEKVDPDDVLSWLNDS